MTKVVVTSRRILLHPLVVRYTVLLIAIIALLMVLAFRWTEPRYMMVSFVAGLILWTFIEYVVNRWLSHADKGSRSLMSLARRYHMRHHEDPGNIQYSLPHPLIILVSSVPLFSLAFPAVGTSALSLTSGFLFGCWLFCILHLLQHHHPAPSAGFLKTLWQHHFLHHDRYPDSAFGVSTHIWDRLFGTLPPHHFFLDIQPSVKPGDVVLHVMQVDDQKSENIFLNVSEAILHDDPHWIPYLRSEIRSIFDPAINPCFKHGAARRWILVDSRGEVLGRIAAFINFKKMYDEKKKVGCIGFFECVNDREAAFLLFDTASRWLVERYHVTSIDGPINFGENDKYWGLLIKGFSSPSYGMNYNPHYYQDLFEAYGFKIQYRQLTTRIDLRKPFPERVNRIAKRVIDSKQYRFIPFRYGRREKFINDFVLIYNQAWADFKNFQPMNADVVRKSLAEMKPIMDEGVIWFTYAGDRPVGFILAVPDINEILKHAGGRFNIRSRLTFMIRKHWKGFSCLRVVVMGIIPEYQQRGLESGLIVHAYRGGKTTRHYKHVELAWVGDFNEKMIAIHRAMGATEDKQHATFRKHLE